jgi:hypothetical protein
VEPELARCVHNRRPLATAKVLIDDNRRLLATTKSQILIRYIAAYSEVLLICRVFFSCCDRIASPQATVWAPAGAPRSRTCAHVDNGALTSEATPRLFAAGEGGATTAEPRLCAADAGGATTAKPCACAAKLKLRPSHRVFEGASPRVLNCFCSDGAGNVYSALLLICRLLFYCCGSVALPQTTVWAPAWAPRSRTCAHVDNWASTPEATPRLFAAGEGGATTAEPRLCAADVGGATTAKPCACAAKLKLRPSHRVFEGHRRECNLACVQIGLVMFTLLFYSSAECSSTASKASRCRRQRSGYRPGHHDQERALMLITGFRRRRPRRGFLPQAQAAQQRPRRGFVPQAQAAQQRLNMRLRRKAKATARSQSFRRRIAASVTLPLCRWGW